MADLIVAGAGMAGLVAAARARELGASVVILEKGDRPGGSFLLSSGFIWRYHDWETFRAQCPGGAPALQRLVHDRLDDDLGWLESLGVSVLAGKTGNPITAGVRVDPVQATETLARRAGEISLREPLTHLADETPVVLATGGFQGNRHLVRRYVTPEAGSLLLRANRWSAGDGLTLALERGASLTKGMDEFYGRNLPAVPQISADNFVHLQQLYALHADVVVNSRGERFEPRHWAEIDVVQWTARQPGARAWYHVSESTLAQRVRDRTVGEMIDAARAEGAAVERRDGKVVVEVAAAITTTLGGIRIDERARAADGLFVAGTDAGGISTGGYSSGLAAALVFGRIAAEQALTVD
jgi:succinate dehydrogenase/fumarate reductase flavoprotein subunit